VKRPRVRLYGSDGVPVGSFNTKVCGWLQDEVSLVEHQPPAAFSYLRKSYDAEFSLLTNEFGPVNAHKILLSDLTRLMLGVGLGKGLAGRLTNKRITEGGFRTTRSQGQAKNSGENFVNLIVYAVARLLAGNDEVLVDKGLPPQLRTALTLTRSVQIDQQASNVRIPIEGDMSIFSRRDPLNAIVISAKTRLKEVFHVGTMWAMFFKMLNEPTLLRKWSISRVSAESTERTIYSFATADMIPPGGRKTQGGDVERGEIRNLIKMDASFFDYVFVSKPNISHVARTLKFEGFREGLFHELGCLIDLIFQKFPESRLNIRAKRSP
jgi:hypothetical protein